MKRQLLRLLVVPGTLVAIGATGFGVNAWTAGSASAATDNSTGTAATDTTSTAASDGASGTTSSDGSMPNGHCTHSSSTTTQS